MKKIVFLISCIILLVSCNNPEQGRSQQRGSAVSAASHSSPHPFTDTLAAVFSQIAYCSQPQAALAQYAPGWKMVWQGQAVGGNYAFAATDGEKIVVSFRGSLLSFTEDAFNNWVYHDLNVVIQEKWPYCAGGDARISRGAFSAWQNIEKIRDQSTGKTLTAFLTQDIKRGTALYLTGHSLGGNLAVVFASWLWYKLDESGSRKPNIHVTTFAAPAAGNTAFANDFDEKFPGSVRIENKNDIVAKFPCPDRISRLGELFKDGPSASEITVGYKSMTTKLAAAFDYISRGLDLLRLSGFTGYAQTCGEGKLLTIALSGRNKNNTAVDWFAEAGYQHSMEQYAIATGAPVIKCD